MNDYKIFVNASDTLFTKSLCRIHMPLLPSCIHNTLILELIDEYFISRID